MPELALDDVDRDALPRELDRVRMAELMRREPTDRSLTGELAQLGAGGGRRPRPATGYPVDHAEQRADRQLDPMLQQRSCSNPAHAATVIRTFPIVPFSTARCAPAVSSRRKW